MGLQLRVYFSCSIENYSCMDKHGVKDGKKWVDLGYAFEIELVD